MIRGAVLTSTLLLAACAMNGGIVEPLENAAGGRCDQAPVQTFIGEDATQSAGREILDASGSQRLRWGAPDSIWTMELNPYRVNVRYDENAVITEITCG